TSVNAELGKNTEQYARQPSTPHRADDRRTPLVRSAQPRAARSWDTNSVSPSANASRRLLLQRGATANGCGCSTPRGRAAGRRAGGSPFRLTSPRRRPQALYEDGAMPASTVAPAPPKRSASSRSVRQRVARVAFRL